MECICIPWWQCRSTTHWGLEALDPPAFIVDLSDKKEEVKA